MRALLVWTPSALFFSFFIIIIIIIIIYLSIYLFYFFFFSVLLFHFEVAILIFELPTLYRAIEGRSKTLDALSLVFV
jgi:hypothetical protein